MTNPEHRITTHFYPGSRQRVVCSMYPAVITQKIYNTARGLGVRTVLSKQQSKSASLLYLSKKKTVFLVKRSNSLSTTFYLQRSRILI